MLRVLGVCVNVVFSASFIPFRRSPTIVLPIRVAVLQAVAGHPSLTLTTTLSFLLSALLPPPPPPSSHDPSSSSSAAVTTIATSTPTLSFQLWPAVRAALANCPQVPVANLGAPTHAPVPAATTASAASAATTFVPWLGVLAPSVMGLARTIIPQPLPSSVLRRIGLSSGTGNSTLVMGAGTSWAAVHPFGVVALVMALVSHGLTDFDAHADPVPGDDQTSAEQGLTRVCPDLMRVLPACLHSAVVHLHATLRRSSAAVTRAAESRPKQNSLAPAADDDDDDDDALAMRMVVTALGSLARLAPSVWDGWVTLLMDLVQVYPHEDHVHAVLWWLRQTHVTTSLLTGQPQRVERLVEAARLMHQAQPPIASAGLLAMLRSELSLWAPQSVISVLTV
jgi:hypothetical protein